MIIKRKQIQLFVGHLEVLEESLMKEATILFVKLLLRGL